MNNVKKSEYRFERRKREFAVALDRRRHDDDFAERMVGGIRTWSPKAPHQPSPKRKTNREGDS
jgi:hypothetical protein